MFGFSVRYDPICSAKKLEHCATSFAGGFHVSEALQKVADLCMLWASSDP